MDIPTRKVNFGAIVTAMWPAAWPRTLALMLLGAVFAGHSLPPPALFLAGFIIVGPLLWGGLYLLNNASDAEHDRQHPLKRERPLAADEAATAQAQTVAWLLIGGALLLSLMINGYFFLTAALMALKQILYTMPPFRLKERFLLDIFAGTLFNPTLRFLSGWFLVSASPAGLPLLFLAALELLKVSFFLVNRLHNDYNGRFEASLGYSSTVTRAPRRVFDVIVSLLILGSIFCVCGALLVGSLPPQAGWLLLIALGGLPLFWIVLKADMGRETPGSISKLYNLGMAFFLALTGALVGVIVLFG